MRLTDIAVDADSRCGRGIGRRIGATNGAIVFKPLIGDCLVAAGSRCSTAYLVSRCPLAYRLSRGSNNPGGEANVHIRSNIGI